MKFDTPATTNPIDRLRVVGKPLGSIDGPLKTTGTAPYAYERHDVARDQAYGHLLGAAIAKGRITAMDTAAAKAAPGVLAVVTTLDMPRLEKGPMNTAFLFGGPQVQHYHQAIAVAVQFGDSDFPVSAGSGGQWGANNATAGVYAACVKLREAVAQRPGFNSAEAEFADGQVRAGNRSVPARPSGRPGRADGRGRDRVRRPRRALPAIDLRGPLRRGRRRRRDRRDAGAANARGLRGGAHPQPQVGAQPGDRRDDHGRGRGADGGAGGGQAPGLLRQPRPGGLRGAGPCRHPAPGGGLPRRGGPDLLAHEGQGRGRARAFAASGRRSPTRSTTRRACASATTRSRSTS